MYQPLEDLDVPQDDEKVWRYLDFTKFLSLLDRQALFFASLKKLADTDKFEGLYPNFDANVFSFIPNFSQTIDNAREFTKQYRQHFFVNCWHLSNIETYAMWKIYLKNEEGIAIKTSFERLKNSFNSCQRDIIIGKVMYDNNPKIAKRIITCFYKRRSFEFEKELRIAFEEIPIDQTGKPNISLPAQANGHYISIDVKNLLEEVIISPTAPPWFYQLTQSTVSKYGFSSSIVRQSSLAEEPQ